MVVVVVVVVVLVVEVVVIVHRQQHQQRTKRVDAEATIHVIYAWPVVCGLYMRPISSKSRFI